MAGTVLVTGGSGYIAGFLIKLLHARGWTIHATVRDRKKEAPTRAALGIADTERLRFFAADLTSDSGWAEAVAGCTHVAHVASPFPAGKVTDEMLVPPARDGALRALRFARDAGVTRFVLTSSVAAVAYGADREKTRYTEADWTDPDAPGIQPYVKSKTIAECAARDWVAREGGQIEFVSVNPSAVLGPVLSDDISTSIQFVSRLLDGSVPGTPRLGFSVVDVRDLAELHYLALTADGIADERFIGAGQWMMMADVARVLRDRLGPRARKVPKRQLPDIVLRALALFDPSIRQVVGELGRVRDASAAHAKVVLGWETRPAQETIVDTAESLLEHGIVKG